jgi:hypothetical protein
MRIFNPRYFEIDLGRIYKSIFSQSVDENQSLESFKNLHRELIPHYKIEPFLRLEKVKENSFHAEYYYQLYKKANQEDTTNLYEYFCYEKNIYHMHTSCIIDKSSSSAKAFAWLFSLMISQYYEHIEYLPKFLNFQLIKNFKGRVAEFHDFLKKISIDHKDQIPPIVYTELTQQLATMQYLTVSYLGNIEQNINQKQEQECDDNMFVFSEEFDMITGNLSKRQILLFFSCLWKEKSVDGKPFLSKEIVEEIFKYGIAIPPHRQKVLRHKLNVSKKFPLAIIHYVIHQFYILHAHGKYSKAQVLRFFCHYFEDFEWALESPETYSNFLSNISGTLPKKMNFNLDDYNESAKQ